MKPPEAKCPICNGRGRLPDPNNDLRVIQCRCEYVKAIRAHLIDPVMALDVGTELWATKPIESPLFKRGEHDLTRENLFLQGSWNVVKLHLRTVLVGKGLRFRYRIVTDARLLRVYLGKESSIRHREESDDVLTFDSLRDVVNPNFDLVVVRLGFVGHTNRALANVIRESLMVREAVGKASWVVERGSQYNSMTFDAVDLNGRPKHTAYGPELADYLDTNYTSMLLTAEGVEEEEPAEAPPAEAPSPEPLPMDDFHGVTVAEDGSLGMGADVSSETPAPAPRVPKPRREVEIVEDTWGSRGRHGRQGGQPTSPLDDPKPKKNSRGRF